MNVHESLIRYVVWKFFSLSVSCLFLLCTATFREPEVFKILMVSSLLILILWIILLMS